MTRADHGTPNKLAEWNFARFRRFQIGQIDKLAPKYLDKDASVAGWPWKTALKHDCASPVLARRCGGQAKKVSHKGARQPGGLLAG
ncbi:hypothetical protein [Candidatus Accumulibacter sp. ACC003]|uniref:hypothetical protein n=1 Tax=Candidatus Accumulibacter sp. ACC003 TaxID=2823334 RepID=UPI0025BFE65B|nr:hypothetical protein [Candidatus Accumulibacter sp. ACC003]